MRRSLLLAAATPLLSMIAACESGSLEEREPTLGQTELANSAGWAGGGGIWGGGGGNWGGGGGEWGGGGGLWGGGGGFWGGGGGNWGGGGGLWGGGGGQWGGGGGYWGGGGGWWGGGGGNWGGGGGNWGGGGGLWGGGFANTFPFLGWNYARHWNFRGVPQQGYSPATPPAMPGTKDAALCPTGTVRLGGFAYPIDAEDWAGYVALGYNAKLCIPTPGNQGLTMNATVGDPSLTKAGGYALTSDLANVGNDAFAMKSMVGWGAANVATQYAGALCASIGSLAAAKRSCGVGIAFSDPNKNRDGTTSQRGVSVLQAQSNTASYNTPFGRAQGYSIYGQAANDMESYASQVLRKHTTVSVPSSPSTIDSWNSTNAAGFSYNGSNFAPVAMSASANATKLFSDANKSVTSPLNMIPVDANTTGATTGNVVLSTDMQKSVAATTGSLYALSLHSLALNQSPLYGSGAGRWFFKSPSDPNVPLMDVSSIFQGSTYVLTGQLTNTPNAATLGKAHISPLSIRYGDWRGDTGTSLHVNSAGQYPTNVASDDDREKRLTGALALQRPLANITGGHGATCAIANTGGKVQCWGNPTYGLLGFHSDWFVTTPTDVPALTSGVVSLVGGDNHYCALKSGGTVKCWGSNEHGQLGLGTIDSQLWLEHLPGGDVPNLTNVIELAAGGDGTCAVTSAGAIKCWGGNGYGEIGDGTTTDRSSPVTVIASGVAHMAAGGNSRCAVLKNGTVTCWGGYFGQPVSPTSTANKPLAIAGITNAKQLATGSGFSCAITTSGAAVCWGTGFNGELGNGTTGITATPVQVTGLTSGVVSISASSFHACAVLSSGAVKCWGFNSDGQLGDGTKINRKVPVAVANLSGTVSSVTSGNFHTCARLSTGNVTCWGDNGSGELGDGTQTSRLTPTPVTGGANNSNIMASQGSVLVNKYAATSGQVAGHIMPLPYSMMNTATGKQALMVTYDPLAVAAAEFIEQYDAHMAACAATTNETDIVEDDGGTFTNGQKQGKRLWACSNASAKTNYMNGMKTFLNGARTYLFGSYKACLTPNNAAYDPYVACSSANIDYSQAHLPYTFWVPDYTTAGAPYYGGTDTTTYTSYFTQVNNTVSSYRTSILSALTTRLAKTLQLAGVAKFAAATNAIVTSHVARPGNYGTDCIQNEGFTYQ